MQKRKDYHVNKAFAEFASVLGHDIKLTDEDLYVTEERILKGDEYINFMQEKRKEIQKRQSEIKKLLNIDDNKIKKELETISSDPGNFTSEQWRAFQKWKNELETYEKSVVEDMQKIKKFFLALKKHLPQIKIIVEKINKEKKDVDVKAIEKLTAQIKNDSDLKEIKTITTAHAKKPSKKTKQNWVSA